MLTIPIPKTDMPALLAGNNVLCRINGEPVNVTLQDGYLCYVDGDGLNNRCQILFKHDIVDCRGQACVHFTCGSHGQDDQPIDCITIDDVK
jgi:hypothetical protein